MEPTGKPGEHGKLLGQHCGARFQMQPLQLQLGRRQLRLQQIAQRVHARLGALPLNPHQTSRKRLLLARRLQFAVHRSSSM